MENHKEPHQGTLEDLKEEVQTLKKFDEAWGEVVDTVCDIIDDCINFRDKKINMNTTNNPILDSILEYISSKYGHFLYPHVSRVDSIKGTEDTHIYIHPFNDNTHAVCLLVIVNDNGDIRVVSGCEDNRNSKYVSLEETYKAIDKVFNYLANLYGGHEDVLCGPCIRIDSYYPTSTILYKVDRLDETIKLGQYDSQGQYQFIGGSPHTAYKMARAMDELLGLLEESSIQLNVTPNSIHINYGRFDIYVSSKCHYHIYGFRDNGDKETDLPVEILETNIAEFAKNFII